MPKHLIDHLNAIPDPRIGNHLRHNLIDVLTIALTATICAIDSFTDMEEFGYARKEWFESFLELPNGIPSHDTFARVFSLLDPEAVERCFMNWTADVYTLTQGEVVPSMEKHCADLIIAPTINERFIPYAPGRRNKRRYWLNEKWKEKRMKSP